MSIQGLWCFVLLALLFLAPAALAQPAVKVSLIKTYTTTDCAADTAVEVSVTTAGPASCFQSDPNWIYTDCNATHLIYYTCSESLCTGGCVIAQEIELGVCNPVDRTTGSCVVLDRPDKYANLLYDAGYRQSTVARFVYGNDTTQTTCGADKFLQVTNPSTPLCRIDSFGEEWIYTTCNQTHSVSYSCIMQGCQNCYITAETPLSACSIVNGFTSKQICVNPVEATPIAPPVAAPPVAPVAAPVAAPIAAPVASSPTAVAAPVGVPISAPTASSNPVAAPTQASNAPKAAPTAPRTPSSDAYSLPFTIVATLLMCIVAMAL